MTDRDMVRGGKRMLGEHKALTEVVDPPSGGPISRYDCSRDVLVFMRFMFSAVVNAFRLKQIPAMGRRLNADPSLEPEVTTVLEGMVKAFQRLRAEKFKGYGDFTKIWDEECNLARNWRGANLVMEVFGRALMEFYFSCVVQAHTPSNPVIIDFEDLLREMEDGSVRKRSIWSKLTFWRK